MANTCFLSFRTAERTLYSLSEVRTRSEIEEALGRLAPDVDYAACLEALPEEVQDDTIHLLQFIIHSKRPLSVGEVEDMFKTWTLSFTYIPGQTKTFSISRYFPEALGISDVGGNISFSNSKTRLSLLNIPAFEPLYSNKSILRTCLIYFSSAAFIIDDVHLPMDQIRMHFPLTAYVVSHLMDHARESGTDQEVNRFLMDFFQSKRTFNVWVRLYVKAWPPLPTDSKGVPSPLWIAVSAGLLGVVRKLAEGVDLNALLTGSLAKDEGTPLMIACRFGHSNITKFLIEQGSNVNTLGGSYGSALQTACFFNHIEIVRLLLNNGAITSFQHVEYGTALQIAAASASPNLIRLLILDGANVNAVPRWGRPFDTALQVACRLGRKDVVEELLDNGADINISSQGTPIEAAISSGSENLIRLLLSRGASVITGEGAICRGLWGCPPKDWANTLRILLDAGFNANARDELGDTPLHRATALCSKEAVELLLQHGAEVNPKDRNSVTPLSLASTSHHIEILDLLKAAGGVE
jgi:ankyrin repeat protein